MDDPDGSRSFQQQVHYSVISFNLFSLCYQRVSASDGPQVGSWKVFCLFHFSKCKSIRIFIQHQKLASHVKLSELVLREAMGET